MQIYLHGGRDLSSRYSNVDTMFTLRLNDFMQHMIKFRLIELSLSPSWNWLTYVTNCTEAVFTGYPQLCSQKCIYRVHAFYILFLFELFLLLQHWPVLTYVFLMLLWPAAAGWDWSFGRLRNFYGQRLKERQKRRGTGDWLGGVNPDIGVGLVMWRKIEGREASWREKNTLVGIKLEEKREWNRLFASCSRDNFG